MSDDSYRFAWWGARTEAQRRRATGESSSGDDIALWYVDGCLQPVPDDLRRFHEFRVARPMESEPLVDFMSPRKRRSEARRGSGRGRRRTRAVPEFPHFAMRSMDVDIYRAHFLRGPVGQRVRLFLLLGTEVDDRHLLDAQRYLDALAHAWVTTGKGHPFRDRSP